jgi:CTP-dependent riboflavin kinase
MSKIPDNVINKDLYIKAKKIADNTYKKPSAYKSAFIQKKYMELGGTYTHKTKGLKNWFSEKWIQVKPYIEENKEIECGKNDNNKACRPSIKINEKTPLTINEIINKCGRDKTLKLSNNKEKDMNNRVNWENCKMYNENDDENEGGNSFLNILEKYGPIQKIKKLASILSLLRKSGEIRKEDEIPVLIARDVYNKTNERVVNGYLPNLSNDEIAVYKNNGIISVGIRGTQTKDDIKTDSFLAIGKLQNTDRYERNKKKLEEIEKDIGKIDEISGHSLGGSLSMLLGDVLNINKIVALNPGAGIRGFYGNKKAHVYISEGDLVSALGLFKSIHNIRVIPSFGDSILDRHNVENFMITDKLKGGQIDNNEIERLNKMLSHAKKYQIVGWIRDIYPQLKPKKVLTIKINDLKDWIRGKTDFTERKKRTKKGIISYKNIDVKYPSFTKFLLDNSIKIPSIEKFSDYLNPTDKSNFYKKLGLKKTNKDEDIKIKKQITESDPLSGSTAIVFNNKPINLQSHQIKFLMGYFLSNIRGTIVFHGIGTGKTYSSVAATKLYLNLYPNNNVIVVTPSAVQFNFIEALAQYGIDPRDSRYKYFTYDKFYRSNIDTTNSMMIIDEAHNFRKYMVEFEEIEHGHVNDYSKPHGFETRLKVNSKDNTITIRPIKESWNRDEVVALIKKSKSDFPLHRGIQLLDKEFDIWIEQNL